MYVIVRHTITSIGIERGTKARKHSAPTKFKIAQVGSEELNFCVVVTHDKNRQQQKIVCQENISSNTATQLEFHYTTSHYSAC